LRFCNSRPGEGWIIASKTPTPYSIRFRIFARAFYRTSGNLASTARRFIARTAPARLRNLLKAGPKV
jgi:hypothetical protein